MTALAETAPDTRNATDSATLAGTASEIARMAELIRDALARRAAHEDVRVELDTKELVLFQHIAIPVDVGGSPRDVGLSRGDAPNQPAIYYFRGALKDEELTAADVAAVAQAFRAVVGRAVECGLLPDGFRA